MIDVFVNNERQSMNKGKNLKELIDELNLENQDIIVAAIVNNNIKELNYKLKNDCKIKFLNVSNVLGNRIYRRSLFLLMAKAIYQIFPGSILSIEHSLSNGMYCELKKKGAILTNNEIREIYSYMRKLVKKDLPIIKHKFKKEKVINIYRKQGFYDRINGIKNIDQEYFTIYELDGYYDYFFYHMVPGTKYLKKFDLKYRYPGFILLFPQKKEPYNVPKFKEQPKLANIFMEYEKLGNMLEVASVNELNNIIKQDNYLELIRISEGLHEKNVALIADEIYKNISEKRIILIAGPSSSGKTTFTRRLSTQLKVNGLKPVLISIDDYFVSREETPRDENGEYDFEALEAVDLELFNNHLIKLLQNRRVEIPEFNFKTGKREYNGRFLQLDDNQPLLIEGIHALNDKLSRVIPGDHKFKIYVSALTQLNIDRHNRIPTTDTRVIRRIVRDNHFRGHSAKKTLTWWPSVRKGEEKNIFPYQENADIMFNSALIYELAALKSYVEPLLKKIKSNNKIYYEAQRLLEILAYFKSMTVKDIPNTSILREFIGGSVFR